MGGETLADFQRAALDACGLDPTPGSEGPALFLNDDLLVGRRLLADFLAAARDVPSGRAVLALEPGVFTEEFAPLQDLERTEGGAPIYPCWYLREGGEPPSSAEGFEPIVLPTRERVMRIPVPSHWFGKEELLIPMTARPALRVRHWMHILFANRVAASERWLRAPAWLRGARILWALCRAMIPTPSRVLRALSAIGRGCSVHPTAVVEGSTLERGVRVGAHAVVRFSHVGAGAFIMDGANVSFSTLGRRSTVATNCSVSFSVLHEEASASQSLLQLSVLGRKAITTGMGYITDMKMGGGDVRVRDGEDIVSSGQRFLGAAIGHEAVLGSGVWIAHGREVPNGYVVVRSPGAMLSRIPTDLPAGEPLAVEDGTLRRLRLPEEPSG